MLITQQMLISLQNKQATFILKKVAITCNKDKEINDFHEKSCILEHLFFPVITKND